MNIGLKHHQNDSAGLFILAQIEKLEGNLKEAETALEQVLLFADDHLAAAEMLCEIQTVLGRAYQSSFKNHRKQCIRIRYQKMKRPTHLFKKLN